MGPKKGADLAIAASLLAIAGALFLYVSWIGSWLKAGPQASAPRGASDARIQERLSSARVRFRENLLDLEAHLRLSEALFAANRPVDAFYVMRAARALFGDSLFMPAHTRIVRGARADEAGQELEKLGRRAQKTGPDGDSALKILEERRGRSPNDAEVFSALAMALWGRGRLKEAREITRRELDRQPDHSGALMLQGSFLLYDQQPQKASEFFARALESNPRNLYSAAKLSQIYRLSGNEVKALPYDIMLYRNDPLFKDTEPIEDRILRVLEQESRRALADADASVLGRFLGSENGSLRAEASLRAAALADPRWVDALAGLLDDDLETVRYAADYALYRIAEKNPEPVNRRRNEWLSSEKPLVRIRALNLFADLDPEGAFPLVERALADARPAVRFFTRMMILDHYYKGAVRADRARGRYLAAEKDPVVLDLYARLKER